MALDTKLFQDSEDRALETVSALSPGVASAISDSMLDVLYNDPPEIARIDFERALLANVREYLEGIQDKLLAEELSEDRVRELLSRLDAWLDGRLCGRNLLNLIKDAEMLFPALLEYMPRVIMARYDEMRVARIWSSLLSPEALRRLSSAIADERRSSDFNLGDL